MIERHDDVVHAYRVSAKTSLALTDPSTFWDALHLQASFLGELPAPCVEAMENLHEYIYAPVLPKGDLLRPPISAKILAWLHDYDIDAFQSRLRKRNRQDWDTDETYEKCVNLVVKQRDKMQPGDHLLILATEKFHP